MPAAPMLVAQGRPYNQTCQTRSVAEMHISGGTAVRNGARDAEGLSWSSANTLQGETGAGTPGDERRMYIRIAP